ncbi:hypothetical protein IJ103_01820 [Candidatus Saccharibacteria bacterium]|nr:hypothetical protein [Candidatus Saccharibacteria bacterium]
MVEGLKKQKVELIDTENEIYTFKLPERITADEYNLMKDIEAFLDRAMERVLRTEGYFMALSPLRIVNDEKLFEIAGKLSKLKRQIVFEKKKIAAKKIDEENRGKIA